MNNRHIISIQRHLICRATKDSRLAIMTPITTMNMILATDIEITLKIDALATHTDAINPKA
jgi:hypothetical protein